MGVYLSSLNSIVYLMTEYFTFKQEKIAFTQKGKGRCIVLLHGFLESKNTWDNAIEELSKKFKVVAVDLPGHGESASYGYVHTMELMAESVKALLDHLRLRKYVLVGHSMGGYVTLAFAENYPDYIKGLVLFHSTAASDTDEKKTDRDKAIRLVKRTPHKYIAEAVKRLFAPHNLETLSDKVKFAQDIAMQTTQQGIIDALEGMKIRPNREVVLKFVDYPVLFINGKYDLVIPYENIQHQLQLAHQTETLLLENSGHMGFFEEPEKSMKAINKFVRKSFGKK